MSRVRDYKNKFSKKSKNIKKSILIVCEGEKTEINYFVCLSDELKMSNVDIVALPAKHQNPVGIVNDAIEEIKYREIDINTGDQVWCVFDRDHHNNSELNRAKTLAESNNISIAFSNPCFEVWYICHYKQTAAPLVNGDGAKSYIKKYISNYHESLCVYHQLKPLQGKALDNAQYLKAEHARIGNTLYSRESDPSTNVDELVQALNDL